MAAEARTSAKALRTSENLVGAVRAEIAASGSFTAERVALRAGTSPATFYLYFPTKDDALSAAFDAVLDRLVEWVDDILCIERLLDGGLASLCADFVAGGVGFFTEETLVFRCALARLPESRDLRATYRRHENDVLERYRRFIGLGQSAGKIRGDDPLTIARALLVFSPGLNTPLAFGLTAEDPLLVELGSLLHELLAPR